MKRSGITLGILLFSVQFLHASTVSLGGTVKNSAGKGIAGATITLAGLAGTSAVTVSQGIFQMSGVGTLLRSRVVRQPELRFNAAGNRLTIPHESGGGGTISWRYSDMLEDRDKQEVENLHHAQGRPGTRRLCSSSMTLPTSCRSTTMN